MSTTPDLWQAVGDESIVNAALIAAAPDLLAALKLGILARVAQRRYFKTRDRTDLMASRAADKAFDDAADKALVKASGA